MTRRRHRGLLSLFDTGVLVLVVGVTIAIGVFVHRTTTSVREGLPASLLAQQKDVAATLHELTELSRLLEGVALRGEQPTDLRPVLAQLEAVEQRLARLRAEHRFDMLTGVADLHAAVAPAIQDVHRWLREGVSGFPLDALTVVSLAASRVEATYERVRGVMDDVNAEAAAVLAVESHELVRFSHSLQLYLAAFALVTVGVVALMIRYRMATRRVARERERLRDSIERIDAGFALYDRDDRLLLCNSRYRSLNPIAEERMVPGVTFSRLAQAGEADRPPGVGPFELRLPGGRVIRVSEHATSEGGTVGIYSEITDLRQAQDRLEHLANHDALTGLANRHQLGRELDRAVASAAGEGGCFALMLLDLDRFKQVNDSYGHASGDRLLCRVAEVVRGCLRGGDTVARVGGDEFAMLVQRPRSRDELAGLARRVLAGLSQRLEVDGNDLRVTGSIGIALYPDDGADLATLERCADMASYEAKRAGRDGFCFFDADLGRRDAQRRTRLSRLRTALSREGAMGVRFLPVRDTADGRATGLRAVPVWHDPALADVDRVTAQRLIEAGGLAAEQSRRMLALTCAVLQGWQSQGIGCLPVTVPVSIATLHSLAFTHELCGQLAEHRLPASLLLVGLEEQAVLDNPRLALETTRLLRRAGVAVSLLALGTGGVSLGLLRELQPAEIELAPDLLACLTEGAVHRALVQSVLLLGRSLGAPVIATGAEEQPLAATAREAGCNRWRADSPALDESQAAAVLRDLAASTPLTLAAPRPPGSG